MGLSKLTIGPGLSLPLEAVTQTFGILAKRGAGKSNAAAVMAEEMFRAGLPFVVVDPVGAWWGLRSSSDGKGPGLEVPIFGGHRGDVPLERGGAELVADLIVDESLSCVVDVSAFDSETAKREFLATFAERLFRRKGAPGRDAPLHLFLEEADDYAPQRATATVARCLGAFQRIVKQGRARGLGSTMITQRSASLSKDLLTQIETLIVLRTTSPQDRKAIEGWVTYHGQAAEILASLHELAPGEAWVWSPWLDLTKRVQIRRRRTFDSGATPTLAAKKAPATLADVDLEVLRERMAATIEKAKAEDPRELRKALASSRSTISNLERRITELEAAEPKVVEPEPVIVVERVEVPIFVDGQVAKLEQLTASLRGLGETLVSVSGGIAEALGRDVAERSDRALPASDAQPPRKAPRPAAHVRLAPIQSPRAMPAASSNGFEPSSSQRRILDSLGWLESVLVPQAKKTQLALLAEQSPTSSGYTNNLGALRSAGLIEYPFPGVVALTDVGRVVADPPSVPLSTEQLQEALCSRLSKSQAAILRALIDAYPEAIPKLELAERVGASPTSSGYTNNLGALRSLGLIDYPAPGLVAALPVLFLEAA